MKKVSILIPAYNEESVLNTLYERLSAVVNNCSKYTYEILFVDDGSTDKTLNKLYQLQEKDPRINILELSRNFGKEIAMLAGFDYVTGDCMIIMDADLQHPPEVMPEMLQYWEAGYDDVYAKRRSRKGESFLKKYTSIVYYRILKKISTIPIQSDTGDFRLLDKTCITALRQIRETQRNTKGIFSWIGFKKKEVLFDSAERVAGETKWSYVKLVQLAIEGITSFTVLPLRLSSFLGMTVSLVSFIYMFFVLTKAMLYGDPVRGYPTLITVILFLGGVQLISLGIIGEYLGQVFNEAKKRPVYLIRSFNGQKITKHDQNN